ncbi:MAG: DUF1549 and DUF1553 domain-containing protein [Bryobacteraceae bacterium]
MLFQALALLLVAAVSVCTGTDLDRDEAFIGKRRAWWAFQKLVRPAPPDEMAGPKVHRPVYTGCTSGKKLSPSALLPKEKLIRRVTLDLTGLPPTPGEVDSFIADTSAKAYEKVVDRLLASPHYGERWAQRWLDVVRFADTNGYELDLVRPHAWRYRDYVVRSFNSDKPYNLFVKEQIAGDELFPANKDALIATGFHRAGPIHLVSGNQDEEMNRQEVLTEMTSAVGSVFLGMTMGCARCHNHKFDPILQADYYRLQGVFAGTQPSEIDLSTPEQRAQHAKALEAYAARIEPIEAEIKTIEKPYREAIEKRKAEKLDAGLKAALGIPAGERNEAQKKLAKDAREQSKASWDEVLAELSLPDRARRAALRVRLHQVERTAPEPLPQAYAVGNAAEVPETFILKIGDPKHKLGAVNPGFPSVLTADNGNVPLEPCSRRSALANWLASPEHPLTSRVMANRIWQLRMGVGLVRTPNDFGMLGQRPTDPKLLDWLASEFVSGGWSVKALDRQILLSSVYRQSSASDPAKVSVDAENKLYWRAHSRRLEAELVRDNVLAVAGNLNPKLEGKPVMVPIEQEIYDIIFTESEPDNLWPLSDESEQRRRSLYLLNKRTVRLPMMTNFDQPDAMTSCPVRSSSTHALQALSLMNSEFMVNQSQVFANRLRAECKGDIACQIQRAYKLTLARSPEAGEVAMAREFLKGEVELADFCLALLNRNEFIYLP